MARIYHKTGASGIVGPDGVQYDPTGDGAFDVPQEVAEFLLGNHIAGEPAWETDGTRVERLAAEEHARRADPANLLTAVERLGGFDIPGSPTRAETAAEKRAAAEKLIAEADAEEAADEAEKAAAAEEAELAKAATPAATKRSASK
jgi:hypothetical protein